jgi:phosphate uptake regulator
MVFKFLRSRRSRVSERLDSVEEKVQAMFRHDRREFDLAVAALLGDAVANDVRGELRATDQQVNQLEREIRRELLVHASVFGGIDSPSVLVYMSIVKDIERVGDYAKNLLDLALDGARLGELADAAEWRRVAADVAQMIDGTGAAFRTRDGGRCRALRMRGDALLHRCDEEVSVLIRRDDPGPQAVARALAWRYLKRVVAHLMNVLSAVIMPLDRLDYFDEDPEDRADHRDSSGPPPSGGMAPVAR